MESSPLATENRWAAASVPVRTRRWPETCVGGVAGAAGDGDGGGGQGGRGVGGVVDLQVQLEPVARRQDDGTGHGRDRAHELGRDGLHVRRETFQHIEVEVVVAGSEGQQHHVPDLIISTIVRHNRAREPSFLAPPRRRPHGRILRSCAPIPVSGPSGGRCGSCGRPDGPCPSTARRASARPCSTPAWTRRWPARSPCSRCAGTTWTRRSSSPTSSCRSSSRASTWRSSPASDPSWAPRSARPTTSHACATWAR